MRNAFAAVMDPSSNPLNKLQPSMKFQLMVYLSMMWTAIFCTGIGSWYFYGHLVVAHVLVAAGVIITGTVFASAKSISEGRPLVSYRDAIRADRTPRYDDVWGA